MNAQGAPFSILFVCTGNQCRSALAEAISRSRAGHRPVEVSSAGTHALESMPSPPETEQAASMLGYELGDHRSRSIDEVEVSAFDLVVGFELAHVAAAVIEHGAEGSKTWLLRQLVSTLEGATPSGRLEDPVANARALVAAAHERRGVTLSSLEDQISDPMGRPASVHRETAQLIDDLCRRLLAVLFPARPPD